jgi:hypothetical protein
LLVPPFAFRTPLFDIGLLHYRGVQPANDAFLGLIPLRAATALPYPNDQTSFSTG